MFFACNEAEVLVDHVVCNTELSYGVTEPMLGRRHRRIEVRI